jgi:hypothetical protein
MNETWHKKHKVPMPSTLQQRVRWHEQHLKHCGCRKDLPKTIVAVTTAVKEKKSTDKVETGKDLQKSLKKAVKVNPLAELRKSVKAKVVAGHLTSADTFSQNVGKRVQSSDEVPEDVLRALLDKDFSESE